MVDPSDIITFPDGKQYITTVTAARLLNLGVRRVRHFIERNELDAVQLEPMGAHYIPLKVFEAFAKKPRKPGRPSTKASSKTAKKATKKKAQK
jgi:hypothetical protein